MMEHKILAACIGDCIHIGGIIKFLQISEKIGYNTIFLGAAIPIDTLIKEIIKNEPEIIAVSYRLTAEVGYDLIKDLISKIEKLNIGKSRFFLGCLPELAKKVGNLEFFESIFIGGELYDEILDKFNIKSDEIGKNQYLKVNHDEILHTNLNTNQQFPDLINRIELKSPYPLLRAHFGLPKLDDTLKGIELISKSKILDIISIAPDQTAQEWLHHPEMLKRSPKGSGGVPIRSRDDLIKLSEKSKTGNFPLLRIYSGTQDLIKNAIIFKETINNAWAAIPIFWYSELDRRGPLNLFDSIKEHFSAIKWYADKGLPVEINDPHQWGLRMAPDYMVVADAYLSARIAKELGVKYYIEQLMFNTPSGVSFKMDLARILAMIEIVEPLIDDSFKVFRETRAGLSYFSLNPTVAKGQLVTSTLFQLAVKPHIIHVVSYCEAEHAAEAENIIESCMLIKKLIQDSIDGLPNICIDPEIQKRKNELINLANSFLSNYRDLAINLGEKNPYLSPKTLYESVKVGLFDAPQLINNPIAKGTIRTEIRNGKCIEIGPKMKNYRDFKEVSKNYVIN